MSHSLLTICQQSVSPFITKELSSWRRFWVTGEKHWCSRIPGVARLHRRFRAITVAAILERLRQGNIDFKRPFPVALVYQRTRGSFELKRFRLWLVNQSKSTWHQRDIS